MFEHLEDETSVVFVLEALVGADEVEVVGAFLQNGGTSYSKIDLQQNPLLNQFQYNRFTEPAFEPAMV